MYFRSKYQTTFSGDHNTDSKGEQLAKLGFTFSHIQAKMHPAELGQHHQSGMESTLSPLASTNALLQNEILMGSPHTNSESIHCTSYQNLAPYSEGELTID